MYRENRTIIFSFLPLAVRQRKLNNQKEKLKKSLTATFIRNKENYKAKTT